MVGLRAALAKGIAGAYIKQIFFLKRMRFPTGICLPLHTY
jgi:hypothetical protein